MKPVKLIIEGINSFIKAQELDFEAVGRSNLFCISGKTGAGKSTIFDAIILALYGKSGRGNLVDMINLSCNSAFVSFEFSEGDDLYRIERTIKCRYERDENGKRTDNRLPGPSECTLYKNGEPVATGSDEAASLVDSVIGLDVAEFKNVYLLEQGEYAEFLKKTPAKQTEAVGKIFSLMRFGDIYKRANEKKQEEAHAVEAAELRIADLGDASPDTLRAAKAELAALKAKSTTLGKDVDEARAEVEKLEKARLDYVAAVEKQKAVKAYAEQKAEAEGKAAAAKDELDAFVNSIDESEKGKLDELRGRINAMSELNALDKEYFAAETALSQKRAALADKIQKQADISSHAAELERKKDADYLGYDGAIAEFNAVAAGMPARSAALENAIKAFGNADRDGRVDALTEVVYALREEKARYDDLCGKKKECEEKLTSAAKRRDELLEKIELYGDKKESAEDGVKRAEENRAAAQRALDEELTRSHADYIRASLKDGDACPVCGGVYHGGVCGGADVDGKRKLLDGASAELTAAQKALSDIEKLLDGAKADHFRADAEHRELKEKLDALWRDIEATRVTEAYGELSIALKKARGYADGYKKSAAECALVEPKRAAAEAERKAAELVADEAAARAAELKDKLGDMCGKTDVAISELKAEEDALRKRVDETEKRRGELASAFAGARAAADNIGKLLDKAVSECPVDMPEFDEEGYNNRRAILDDMIKSLAERDKDIAVKTEQVALLTEKCEKLKNLEAERKLHAKRADCYGTIADMTKGKAMLNYVAEEYIADFTAIASDILTELSGGKYTMSYDRVNGFTVADFLNGGKARKTDTLSGGELFLASLAVAIAIARAVSKGNNAFFFLDEGFGTLDDELIDTVYAALESLSRDCLVGVITHASALIDRMPSVVSVIEATDTEGSLLQY